MESASVNQINSMFVSKFCPSSPVIVGRLESFHPADFDSGVEELVKVQEASSRGLVLGKAQLIRPSQNNSLRMHCRLDGEHRLESVWITDQYKVRRLNRRQNT